MTISRSFPACIPYTSTTPSSGPGRSRNTAPSVVTIRPFKRAIQKRRFSMAAAGRRNFSWCWPAANFRRALTRSASRFAFAWCHWPWRWRPGAWGFGPLRSSWLPCWAGSFAGAIPAGPRSKRGTLTSSWRSWRPWSRSACWCASIAHRECWFGLACSPAAVSAGSRSPCSCSV